MKHLKALLCALFAASAVCLAGFGVAEAAPADAVPVYRLYNPYSYEHIFTADDSEKADLETAGWNYEDIAWYAPVTSKTPVHRLLNPYSLEHLYTADETEKNDLIHAGWNYEDICWYSDDAHGVAVYRLFNPWLPEQSSHHYTADQGEYNLRVSDGWQGETVKFYGVKQSGGSGSQPQQPGDAEPFYWVNTNSKIVHGDSCPSLANANLSASHWRQVYTAAEAQGYLDQGYKKCSVCNPTGITDATTSPENPSGEQQTLESLSGWWQSVGTSGNYMMHIKNGRAYLYYYNRWEGSKSFVNESAITLERVESIPAGAIDVGTGGGYWVTLGSNQQSKYIYSDQDHNMLVNHFGPDLSGSSASDSYYRTTDVPQELIDFANQHE